MWLQLCGDEALPDVYSDDFPGTLKPAASEERAAIFNRLVEALTNNEPDVEYLTWLKTWKGTGVVSAVSHLRVCDHYGGVAALQLIFKM